MKTWPLFILLLLSLAPLQANHHAGGEKKAPAKKENASDLQEKLALNKKLAKLTRAVNQEHREWARLDREYRRALKDNPEAAAPYREAIQILKKEHKQSHIAKEKLEKQYAAMKAPAPKSCGMETCVCKDCKKGTCGCDTCKPSVSTNSRKGVDQCQGGECKGCAKCKGGRTKAAPKQAPKANSDIQSLEAEARELVKKAEELQKKVEALQKSGSQ